MPQLAPDSGFRIYADGARIGVMSGDASQVAGWMVEQLDRNGVLDDDLVISEIHDRFGDDFLDLDEHKNVAISQKVLKEFGRLTQGSVSRDKVNRCWRRVGR